MSDPWKYETPQQNTERNNNQFVEENVKFVDAAQQAEMARDFVASNSSNLNDLATQANNDHLAQFYVNQNRAAVNEIQRIATEKENDRNTRAARATPSWLPETTNPVEQIQQGTKAVFQDIEEPKLASYESDVQNFLLEAGPEGSPEYQQALEDWNAWEKEMESYKDEVLKGDYHVDDRGQSTELQAFANFSALPPGQLNNPDDPRWGTKGYPEQPPSRDRVLEQGMALADANNLQGEDLIDYVMRFMDDAGYPFDNRNFAQAEILKMPGAVLPSGWSHITKHWNQVPLLEGALNAIGEYMRMNVERRAGLFTAPARGGEPLSSLADTGIGRWGIEASAAALRPVWGLFGSDMADLEGGPTNYQMPKWIERDGQYVQVAERAYMSDPSIYMDAIKDGRHEVFDTVKEFEDWGRQLWWELATIATFLISNPAALPGHLKSTNEPGTDLWNPDFRALEKTEGRERAQQKLNNAGLNWHDSPESVPMSKGLAEIGGSPDTYVTLLPLGGALKVAGRESLRGLIRVGEKNIPIASGLASVPVKVVDNIAPLFSTRYPFWRGGTEAFLEEYNRVVRMPGLIVARETDEMVRMIGKAPGRMPWDRGVTGELTGTKGLDPGQSIDLYRLASEEWGALAHTHPHLFTEEALDAWGRGARMHVTIDDIASESNREVLKWWRDKKLPEIEKIKTDPLLNVKLIRDNYMPRLFYETLEHNIRQGSVYAKGMGSRRPHAAYKRRANIDEGSLVEDFPLVVTADAIDVKVVQQREQFIKWVVDKWGIGIDDGRVAPLSRQLDGPSGLPPYGGKNPNPRTPPRDIVETLIGGLNATLSKAKERAWANAPLKVSTKRNGKIAGTVKVSEDIPRSAAIEHNVAEKSFDVVEVANKQKERFAKIVEEAGPPGTRQPGIFQKSVLETTDEEKVVEVISNPVHIENEALEHINIASEGQAAHTTVVPEGATLPSNEAVKQVITEEAVIPITDLRVDADRLQFKQTGINEEGVDPKMVAALGGEKGFDEAFSGVFIAWRRADGELFVVNGHHRKALAEQSGFTGNVMVRILDEVDHGVSVKQARHFGALYNSVEGTAIPMDIATYLRDSVNPENAILDLQRHGVNPNQDTVARATALARLSEPVFRKVKTGAQIIDLDGKQLGNLTEDRAVKIGEVLGDPELHIYHEEAMRDITRGRGMSPGHAEEYLRHAQRSGVATITEEVGGEQQLSMFAGPEGSYSNVVEKTLGGETGWFIDAIKIKLRGSKRLLKSVEVGKETVEQVIEGGAKLDLEKTADALMSVAQKLELFDSYSIAANSPTSNLINDLATRSLQLQAPGPEKLAPSRARSKILKEAVKEGGSLEQALKQQREFYGTTQAGREIIPVAAADDIDVSAGARQMEEPVGPTAVSREGFEAAAEPGDARTAPLQGLEPTVAPGAAAPGAAVPTPGVPGAAAPVPTPGAPGAAAFGAAPTPGVPAAGAAAPAPGVPAARVPDAPGAAGAAEIGRRSLEDSGAAIRDQLGLDWETPLEDDLLPSDNILYEGGYNKDKANAKRWAKGKRTGPNYAAARQTVRHVLESSGAEMELHEVGRLITQIYQNRLRDKPGLRETVLKRHTKTGPYTPTADETVELYEVLRAVRELPPDDVDSRVSALIGLENNWVSGTLRESSGLPLEGYRAAAAKYLDPVDLGEGVGRQIWPAQADPKATVYEIPAELQAQGVTMETIRDLLATGRPLRYMLGENAPGPPRIYNTAEVKAALLKIKRANPQLSDAKLAALQAGRYDDYFQAHLVETRETFSRLLDDPDFDYGTSRRDLLETFDAEAEEAWAIYRDFQIHADPDPVNAAERMSTVRDDYRLDLDLSVPRDPESGLPQAGMIISSPRARDQLQSQAFIEKAHVLEKQANDQLRALPPEELLKVLRAEEAGRLTPPATAQELADELMSLEHVIRTTGSRDWNRPVIVGERRLPPPVTVGSEGQQFASDAREVARQELEQILRAADADKLTDWLHRYTGATHDARQTLSTSAERPLGALFPDQGEAQHFAHATLKRMETPEMLDRAVTKAKEFERPEVPVAVGGEGAADPMDRVVITSQADMDAGIRSAQEANAKRLEAQPGASKTVPEPDIRVEPEDIADVPLGAKEDIDRAKRERSVGEGDAFEQQSYLENIDTGERTPPRRPAGDDVEERAVQERFGTGGGGGRKPPPGYLAWSMRNPLPNRPNTIVYLPKEIVEALNRVGQRQAGYNGFDAFMAVQRALVTQVFPDYHTRNVWSGYYRMLMDGVWNPVYAIKALQLLRAAQNPSAAKVKTININRVITNPVTKQSYGPKISPQEAVYLMEEYGGAAGIFSTTGEIGDLLNTNPIAGAIDEIGNIELDNLKQPGSRISKFVSTISTPGRHAESLIRMTHLLGRLDKGDDLFEAIAHVRKFQVDYSDLTQFEKTVMRRYMFFYTYMRKAMTLEMEQMIKGRRIGPVPIGPPIVNMQRARSWLHEELDPEHNEARQEAVMFRRWILDRLNVGMGRTTDGHPMIAYATGLPVEYVNNWWSGTSLRTMETLMQSYNPIIKGLYEQTMDYSLFTRGKLTSDSMQNFMTKVNETMANFPGARNWLEIEEETYVDPETGETRTYYLGNPRRIHILGMLLPGFVRAMRTIEDTRTQELGPARILNLVTGAKITSFDTTAEVTIGYSRSHRQAFKTYTDDYEKHATNFLNDLIDGREMTARASEVKQNLGQSLAVADAKLIEHREDPYLYPENIRKAIQLTLLSAEDQAIQELENLSPDQFDWAGVINWSAYWHKYDALWEELTEEQRATWQRRRERFIERLGPNGQIVERMRRDAMEVTNAIAKLPRYIHPTGNPLSDSLTERIDNADREISGLSQNQGPRSWLRAAQEWIAEGGGPDSGVDSIAEREKTVRWIRMSRHWVNPAIKKLRQDNAEVLLKVFGQATYSNILHFYGPGGPFQDEVEKAVFEEEQKELEAVGTVAE